ncbi:hypothetical protein S922_14125 [Salmonella enterica subsp. enterica]|nr:hypothetical protein [Salmonella enterica subsp. enterica]EAW9773094.1 hypothetical protein [Salmonella enterica]
MIYLNQHYFSTNREPGVLTKKINENYYTEYLGEIAELLIMEGGFNDDNVNERLDRMKYCNRRDYELLMHLYIIKILKQIHFEKLAKHVCRYYEEAMDDELFAEEDPDGFLLQGLQSDLMREISSKTRHKHYDEIIQIIKNTWKKYPSGSKKEMVRQIIEHFKGEVNESTLLRWIKKENLTPPRPSRYTTLTLVLSS